MGKLYLYLYLGVVPVRRCVGVSDADGEAHGEQELSGEAPRGGGDSGLDVDDLLGQDGHTDAEPDDRRTHVVRLQHQGSRHQRGPVQ